MRALLVITLLTVSLGSLLLYAEPQQADPPLPDAVPFCHMPIEHHSEYENCMCASTKDQSGAIACEDRRKDTGLPYFCKHMCGHSKDCQCCPS